MNSDYFSEITEAVQAVQLLNVREVRAEKDGIYAVCEVASRRCYPYRTYTVNNKYNIKIDASLYVDKFYRYAGDKLEELPDTGYLDDAVYSAVYDEVVVKIYDYTKSKYESALESDFISTISPGFYLSCGDEVIYEKRIEFCNENTEKITRMNIFTLAEKLANKEIKKDEAYDYIKLAYLDSMSAIYLNKLYIITEVAALTEFRSSAAYLTDAFQKVMLFGEYGYRTDDFAALGFMNNLMESENVRQTADGAFISEKLLEAHSSELDNI
ncbi:MAG: hypothetical protein E7218_03805 [Anaerofustis stercorihominis]|nr:hypothetical protein [Anaerofustis stercorihominis]